MVSCERSNFRPKLSTTSHWWGEQCSQKVSKVKCRHDQAQFCSCSSNVWVLVSPQTGKSGWGKRGSVLTSCDDLLLLLKLPGRTALGSWDTPWSGLCFLTVSSCLHVVLLKGVIICSDVFLNMFNCVRWCIPFWKGICNRPIQSFLIA